MKVLVPLADGIEMIEALSVVDVFRRAGADVETASVNEKVITSSHNVKIEADRLIEQCMTESYDLIAVPGGIPGAENLSKSESLVTLLQQQSESGKLYGAICASPAVVLENHGLLKGKKATCHPGFVAYLDEENYQQTAVVTDQNCVTSRGAGTSVLFALELCGMLMGEEKKKEVAAAMVVELD